MNGACNALLAALLEQDVNRRAYIGQQFIAELERRAVTFRPWPADRVLA